MARATVGWFKTPRTLLTTSIFKNAQMYQLFTYLVGYASFKPTKINLSFNKSRTIERGQLIDSARNISKELGCSINTVRKYLKRLEADGIISMQSFKYGTIVTIHNYTEYADEGVIPDQFVKEAQALEEIEPQITKKRPIKREFADVLKRASQVYQPVIHVGAPSDTIRRIRRIKEKEKIKNKKENFEILETENQKTELSLKSPTDDFDTEMASIPLPAPISINRDTFKRNTERVKHFSWKDEEMKHQKLDPVDMSATIRRMIQANRSNAI